MQQRYTLEENPPWQNKTQDPNLGQILLKVYASTSPESLRWEEQSDSRFAHLSDWEPTWTHSLSYLQTVTSKQFQTPKLFSLWNIWRGKKASLINKKPFQMTPCMSKLLLLNATVRADLPVISKIIIFQFHYPALDPQFSVNAFIFCRCHE